MENDEWVDVCNHLAPLKVKYIFLDLFLWHCQNSFGRIGGLGFGLFSFWIILSSLLHEIYKEMLTCLRFNASFHLCLPKSLISLPLVSVCSHTHRSVYIHTCAGEHNPQNLGYGYLTQHPPTWENRMRNPGIFQTTAIGSSTCPVAFISKEFFMCFSRMVVKQGWVSLSIISLERQRDLCYSQKKNGWGY